MLEERMQKIDKIIGEFMSNTEFLKKQLLALDVKSDEFFDIYTAMCDKYFHFPDPDDFQSALMVIYMYLNKAGNHFEEQVVLISKLIEQIFHMERDEVKSIMITLGFKDVEYFVSVTTDKKHLKEMGKILGQVAKGKFKFKK